VDQFFNYLAPCAEL